jgi:hypothetical protein
MWGEIETEFKITCLHKKEELGPVQVQRKRKSSYFACGLIKKGIYLATPATCAPRPGKDIIGYDPSINQGFDKLAIPLLFCQLCQPPFEHHLLCRCKFGRENCLGGPNVSVAGG